MNLPLDIAGLRNAVRAGELTIREVIERAFERAHATQPRLKAFCHLPETLDILVSDPAAPLAGIAVAMKDLVDTADMPTTYGSPIHEGQIPARDAWIVERLRGLGAHVLGKTVTTEFAWRHPGVTVNPWNLAHSPGGSSSGSAAAVAAGIAPLGIGTQTLGSVIRPAAYCGVVGYKPSFGVIPRSGICALSSSLDHVGLFTRSVADATHVLSLLAGPHSEELHGQRLPHFELSDVVLDRSRPPRVGVLDSTLLGGITLTQALLMQDIASRLRAAGAEVVEVSLPPEFAEAAEVTVALVAAEAARHHHERMERFAPLLSGPMKDLIARGRSISAAQYAELKERQRGFLRSYTTWINQTGIDLLLMPPASGEAPEGLETTGDPCFCSPITLVGVPTITLPAGFGRAGLPLGVQLAGTTGQDVALLRAALWCEDVIAHPITIPPLAYHPK
jgi:Asp-tRNA(Asn)/Glu-tRNA(Gln) amidotransferase A subunit family amidase